MEHGVQHQRALQRARGPLALGAARDRAPARRGPALQPRQRIALPRTRLDVPAQDRRGVRRDAHVLQAGLGSRDDDPVRRAAPGLRELVRDGLEPADDGVQAKPGRHEADRPRLRPDGLATAARARAVLGARVAPFRVRLRRRRRGPHDFPVDGGRVQGRLPALPTGGRRIRA